MNKIGDCIGTHEILETCDRNGIIQQSYMAIYKQFKGVAKIASKLLRSGWLSNPNWAFVVRTMLNLKLPKYVRDYYSITTSLQIAPTSKSKGKKPMKIIFDENKHWASAMDNGQNLQHNTGTCVCLDLISLHVSIWLFCMQNLRHNTRMYACMDYLIFHALIWWLIDRLWFIVCLFDL